MPQKSNNSFSFWHLWVGKNHFKTICRSILIWCNWHEFICQLLWLVTCWDSTDDSKGRNQLVWAEQHQEGWPPVFCGTEPHSSVSLQKSSWHICEFLLAKAARKLPNIFSRQSFWCITVAEYLLFTYGMGKCQLSEDWDWQKLTLSAEIGVHEN